jgi:hypothetical protein
MSEFTPLREAVDTLADGALPPDFGELERRATRRGRRRVAIVAAAAIAAVIAGSVLAITGLDDDRRTAPVEQPKPVVGAVPVWYDANGLHRGDVVEQTPVEVGVLGGNSDTLKGALALVRSGAVYQDPATGDVWFHPWGGDPRIVGHNSEAGPGGDPNGDTAAWFEGSDALNAGPGELVVYDTAAGREISRTMERHGVTGTGGDHYPAGNTFLQVSAERVVWTSWSKIYSHDVRTQRTSVVEDSYSDVHDQVEVGSDGRSLVLRVPGLAEGRYPELESHVRLSPSGNYVLAVESTEARHAAVIVDTRTGELWRVPKNAYPWIAWSYGDIALVDTEDALLACDAARRACESLPAEHPFLMPTN